MRAPRPERPRAPDGFFTKGEMRKVVLMLVAAVVLVATLVTSLLRDGGREEIARSDLPEEVPVMEERVAVPDVDVEALEAAVDDAREEDRAALERPGVERLLGTVRPLTRAHYEAMDTREIDADLAERMLAAPSEFRGEAFHARGWVASHRARTYDGNVEHHVRLTLEDGTTVYAVLLEAPALGFELDADFVRIDGLFLKAFMDETDDGWLAGPLLVGRGAERSFPALPPVEELDAASLGGVEDFSLENGASGLPFEPLWRMMAHARDVPEDAIDWEAAPELNANALGALMTDGAAHRGRPFRIPVSKLMGVTVKAVGENPARLDRVTEGWIGNYSWPHLVHFRAPFARDELDWGVYVQARGFFFKKFAYDSKSEGVQAAPVFVLHSLDRFVPPVDDSVPQLMVGVAAVTIATILLLFFLISRDRRRSQQLHEALVRRRRARRARRTQAEGG